MENIKEYKFKFVIFIVFILLLLTLFFLLLKKSFSSYLIDADIDLDIEHAVYVFDAETVSFDIDTTDIVPRSEPYVYTFTVANYNDTKQSDVDLEYNISMITTTNLPLTYELYRNESYQNGTNIINNNSIVTDDDGTFYRKLDINNTYNFYYNARQKDTYYLVVYYNEEYIDNLDYIGLIDNIEIKINSNQIVE